MDDVLDSLCPVSVSGDGYRHFPPMVRLKYKSLAFIKLTPSGGTGICHIYLHLRGGGGGEGTGWHVTL